MKYTHDYMSWWKNMVMKGAGHINMHIYKAEGHYLLNWTHL